MSYASLFRLNLPRQQGKSSITLPIIGYRKDGRPIFPIMGGEDSPDAAAQAAAAAAAAQAAADAAKNTGPVEAKDPETGVGLGFPAETKVEDMNADQKAAYWRNQAKVQQKKVPANLDQLQSDAQKWAEYQRTQMTPSDQAIAAARDEARASALKEAAEESAMTALRATLLGRGKNATEVEELVEFVSPSRFLTQDSKVDTTKVMSLADKLAPVVNGGSNIGQGRYDQAPTDRAAAGRDEAKRRGFTPAERKPPTVLGK